MKHSLMILVTWLFMATSAMANDDTVKVGVIVGDEAISTVDIENRVDLAVFSSGLEPTPEIMQRLLPQVVRLLIDEHIYRQEAKKHNLTLSQEELARARASVEEKNGIAPGTLDQFLLSKNVDLKTFDHQMQSHLLWNKVIRRKVRPKVRVTEKEVDERLENIASNAGVQEYDISEIVLPVEDPKQEQEVKQLAQRMADQIKEGADFGSVARQFSRSQTAEKGGDVGWIQAVELPRNVASALTSLEYGHISDPIRTVDSFMVVRLNKRRTLVHNNSGESEIGLRQAFVRFDTALEASQQADQLTRLTQDIEHCDQFEAFASKVQSVVDPKMVMTQFKALNNKVREVVEPVDVGQVAPILKSSTGFHVFMLCEKTEAMASLAQRQRVRNDILQHKVNLQAKRYLRDLRRNLFIEVRL